MTTNHRVLSRCNLHCFHRRYFRFLPARHLSHTTWCCKVPESATPSCTLRTVMFWCRFFRVSSRLLLLLAARAGFCLTQLVSRPLFELLQCIWDGVDGPASYERVDHCTPQDQWKQSCPSHSHRLCVSADFSVGSLIVVLMYFVLMGLVWNVLDIFCYECSKTHTIYNMR